MALKLNETNDHFINVENTSLISGTHRPQDLIPVLLDAISETVEYEQILINNDIPSSIWESDDDPWWLESEAEYLIEELAYVLEIYAPEGFFFGARAGDGADFGFFKLEDM